MSSATAFGRVGEMSGPTITARLMSAGSVVLHHLARVARHTASSLLGAAGQVVEGDQGVGLAAAEVRLQLDGWFAAPARKAQRGFGKEACQSSRQVGAREKRLWVLVLGAGFARRNERQVCCELSLGQPARGNIVMRSHDVAPRRQAGLGLAFG